MKKLITVLTLLMGLTVSTAPAFAYYQFAPANQNNDGGNN